MLLQAARQRLGKKGVGDVDVIADGISDAALDGTDGLDEKRVQRRDLSDSGEQRNDVDVTEQD